MLKYSIVYKLLHFPTILIKFVSKFIVCKVLYFKALYLLRLRSPLTIKRSQTSQNNTKREEQNKEELHQKYHLGTINNKTVADLSQLTHNVVTTSLRPYDVVPTSKECCYDVVFFITKTCLYNLTPSNPTFI